MNNNTDDFGLMKKQQENTDPGSKTNDFSVSTTGMIVAGTISNILTKILSEGDFLSVGFRLCFTLLAIIYGLRAFFCHFHFSRLKSTAIILALSFVILLGVRFYLKSITDVKGKTASLMTIQYGGVVCENGKEYPVTVTLVLENDTLLEGSTLVYDRFKEAAIKIIGHIVNGSLVIYEIVDEKKNAALFFPGFNVMDKEIEGEWCDLIDRNRGVLQIALTQTDVL